MAGDWESVFSGWARPPGQAETDRIENAIRAIRKALDADSALRPLTKVFVQGSYRNRVNVRRDSDVDIGVLYTGNSFGTYYPPGTTGDTFGNVAVDYGQADFKNDVEHALVAAFGRQAVTRGNNAFHIHENSYRIDADVVPLFTYRQYVADSNYICGVQLYPDRGSRIINWPERLYDDRHWPNQHYENAIAKNSATNRAYKGAVRVLKTLRNRMAAEGVPAAGPVPGFFVECLVWNTPNHCCSHATWDAVVQSVLLHLWSNTKTDEACLEWGEVSELKYLFKGSPGSKRQQAHDFADEAWSHVGVR